MLLASRIGGLISITGWPSASPSRPLAAQEDWMISHTMVFTRWEWVSPRTLTAEMGRSPSLMMSARMASTMSWLM